MKKDIDDLMEVIQEMQETAGKLTEIVQRLMIEEAKRRMREGKDN